MTGKRLQTGDGSRGGEGTASLTAAGIGHNNGPSLEPGHSWRRHVWTRARADLLPTLPIEVVRLRVRRAAELGLPYRTYASVRASTGHDLIGFLFSSNALRVMRSGLSMPDDCAAKLATLHDCARIGLAVRPVRPADLAPLDQAWTAPAPWQPWPVVAARMRAVLAEAGGSSDRFLLVGEAGFERDWSEAGRMAGFVSGSAYFSASVPG